MAFLNRQEREALLDEIKTRKPHQIRNILTRKDPKARLAYYRNVQESGKWMTRWVLEGLGTQVTLYETLITNERNNKREYTLDEIRVEPTPGNRLE